MDITRDMLRKLALDSNHTIVCDDTPYSVAFIKVPNPLDQAHNIKINYATSGSGPDLLLIHGWSSAWYSWLPVVKHLRKNYTLHIIDLPGFGKSDKLQNHTVSLLADAVISFIQNQKINPLAIAGLSMGTYVTAEIVKKDPNITNKIFLIGPVLKTDLLNRISHMLTVKGFEALDNNSHMESAAKKIFDVRVIAYIMDWLFGVYKFSTDKVDEYSQLARTSMSKEAFSDMFISAMRYPLITVLSDIKCRVYLVLGDHDKLTSEDEARKQLSEEHSNITLDKIKDSGHCVNIEQPEELAKFITSQLTKVAN